MDGSHAIAHDKVVIVDERTVITGSFNFSAQAEASNGENLLVIEGHPVIAKAYVAPSHVSAGIVVADAIPIHRELVPDVVGVSADSAEFC